MSIKHQNLHTFKEGLILLCQNILEMRKITHLRGSAYFTIPLNMTLFVLVKQTLTQPFLLTTIILICQGIIYKELITLAIQKVVVFEFICLFSLQGFFRQQNWLCSCYI